MVNIVEVRGTPTRKNVKDGDFNITCTDMKDYDETILFTAIHSWRDNGLQIMCVAFSCCVAAPLRECSSSFIPRNMKRPLGAILY